MVDDWQRALDFIQAQEDIGVGAVGYWGLSMGTIYGAPLVAAEARFRAAVLGLMGVSGPDHYRPLIEQAAADIDIPVLFIMQLEDELFSRPECLALFDAISTQDKRLHANAGLHPAVPVEELARTLSATSAAAEPTGRPPGPTIGKARVTVFRWFIPSKTMRFMSSGRVCQATSEYHHSAPI